jgi:NADH dehydrogenase
VILVTGGTGTLGRELVRRLVEAGESVRVMTRDRERAKGLPPSNVEIVVGDLGDDASVTAAMRGCDRVVSAAHGFVGPGNPTPEAVDREGNQRLVRAAIEAKVVRFVLVSVVGASVDHPMSLARAKFAAERDLRESGLRFSIVRAMPFMETWLSIFGGMLDAKGQALVFGPGKNPVGFVSVRDVAALVVESLCGESQDVREIGGPENVGLATVAERVIAARGQPAPIKHIPLPALRMMSYVARPFAPSFARQVQAAVLMNTTDMTAPSPSGITTFADVLIGVRGGADPPC